MLRLTIASYSAPSRLALDAHDSPRKAQFVTFRGIDNGYWCAPFQVANGNFAIRLHAIQHAVKEGFTKEDMIYVVLHGAILEAYPERNRCLFYADVTIERIRMPLHVVCEHIHSEGPVDFVTAYIPSEDEWERPTQRRKKR